MLYLGHSLGDLLTLQRCSRYILQLLSTAPQDTCCRVSYPFAEMQSVYSRTLADWAIIPLRRPDLMLVSCDLLDFTVPTDHSVKNKKTKQKKKKKRKKERKKESVKINKFFVLVGELKKRKKKKKKRKKKKKKEKLKTNKKAQENCGTWGWKWY